MRTVVGADWLAEAEDAASAMASSDAVDVEGRGVGREDRPLPHRRIEGTEHLFLDGHVLEHRLDDQVDIGDGRILEHGLEQPHARLQLRRIEFALLDLRFVELANACHAAIERLLAHLEQAHRDAGIEEVDGDAGTHGAGADDRHAPDLPRLRVGRHVVDA
jgi:hypothetical protein